MEDKGVANRYKSYAYRLHGWRYHLRIPQRHLQSALEQSIVIHALKSKWLWIIIGILTLMLLVPALYVAMLMAIPLPWRVLAVFLPIFLPVIGWGVVSGYKDWILYRRREQNIRRC